MIKLVNDGNIFDSKCDALVCPVNCMGVMGRGLALEFKKRYPKAYIATLPSIIQPVSINTRKTVIAVLNIFFLEKRERILFFLLL